MIESEVRFGGGCGLTPEEVFAALDSDQGGASFQAASAVEVDASIELQFINGHTCTSKVLERRPPHVLWIDYIGGAARSEPTADGVDRTRRGPAQR